MKKSKLALGVIATILTVSSVHALAAEASEQSSDSTSNHAVDKNTEQQEVFLEHVNSVVGKPVYQSWK